MNEQITKRYAELLVSMQSYISQEHTQGSWLETDPSTYSYFFKLASKASKAAPPSASKPAPTALGKQQAQQPHYSQPLKPISTPTAPGNFQNQALSPPAVKPPPSPPSLPNTTQALTQPSSEAPKKEPAKPLTVSKTFTREVLPEVVDFDFSEIRALFQTKLSNVELVETIVDDSQARALASRWKIPLAEICLLSFDELPKEQAFLSNLMIAIKRSIGSAQIISAKKIEEEKGWEKLLKAENLRLIIANNYNLHTLPELMKLYREDATGKHTLGKTPVYLLSDLSLYMQQPTHKASLWKALCQFK